MEAFNVQGYSQSWFDRNGFPPYLVALVWVVIAFLLFQGIGSVAAILLILYKEGSVSESALVQNPEILLIGNSIGQVFGLAVATLMVARLSALPFEYRSFLRLEIPKGTVAFTGYSILLVIVIQPTIWAVSWLNQQIPFPESWIQMEEVQIQLLEALLTTGIPLWFLIFSIALVPAVCEEVIFRGYLLRLFEKSTGVLWAIFITGLLFGAFHLRVTQLIPLSLIGVLLAWVTIQSGSLIPAIIMHLVHNGATVIAVHFYPQLIEIDSSEAIPPVWLILASVILTVYGIYLYKKITYTLTE